MICKFCRRKIGKERKRGKLDYVIIYPVNMELGYFVCLNCAKRIKEQLNKLIGINGSLVCKIEE